MSYPSYTDFTLILLCFSYCQLDAFCHFNKVLMYVCMSCFTCAFVVAVVITIISQITVAPQYRHLYDHADYQQRTQTAVAAMHTENE